jgi:hypothetical protein
MRLTSRFLFAAAFSTTMWAQVPQDIPGFGLPAAEADKLMAELAKGAPFLRKDWGIKAVFQVFGNKSSNEDAQPLLPAEFLALPRDQWPKALHPDTAILLVLRLSRAAAVLTPELAASPDWMLPIPYRLQQVGGRAATSSFQNLTVGNGPGSALGTSNSSSATMRNIGPNTPNLVFRRNVQGSSPLEGLMRNYPLVQADLEARSWARTNSSANWAPEMLIPPDKDARIEVENWILARICIARALGKWDPPFQKSALLKIARPLVPDWDAFLKAKLVKATEAASGSPVPPAH